MPISVGINGFGRIGRCFLRLAINDPDIEVKAINDVDKISTLAHLFKYDSVHGRFNGDLYINGQDLIVNGKKIKYLMEKEPTKLPWKDLGVDIVLESTGKFTEKASASVHLSAGARKVVISAPSKDPDITIVLGVNETRYDPAKHHIISNASCTTNCIAPVVKVLHQNFKVLHGLMTTIHAYTNDQRLHDAPHKDLRRARAAAVSQIPTTTGAAKAVGLVIPELNGKLNGLSIRVPTANVSLVDFVCTVENKTSVEEINNAFKEAANSSLKRYLGYTEEPLVSVDFNGSLLSGIVDGSWTMVIDGTLVKVLAWYDNEMGYSQRCVDLVKIL